MQNINCGGNFRLGAEHVTDRSLEAVKFSQGSNSEVRR